VSDPAYELGAVLCVEVEEDVDAVEYIEALQDLGLDVGGSVVPIVVLV